MIESPETGLLARLHALIQNNVDLTMVLVELGENPIDALEWLKVMDEASFEIAGLPSSLPTEAGQEQPVSDLH